MGDIGFDEYLKITGASSRLFFRFVSGVYRLFKELGRHVNRGGSRECPNIGPCKELVEHALCVYVK